MDQVSTRRGTFSKPQLNQHRVHREDAKGASFAFKKGSEKNHRSPGESISETHADGTRTSEIRTLSRWGGGKEERKVLVQRIF